MPLYEYVCDACEKKFDEFLRLNEFNPNKKPKCPVCLRKRNVRRLMTGLSRISMSKDDGKEIAVDSRWSEVPVPNVPISADGVVQLDHNDGRLL